MVRCQFHRSLTFCKQPMIEVQKNHFHLLIPHSSWPTTNASINPSHLHFPHPSTLPRSISNMQIWLWTFNVHARENSYLLTDNINRFGMHLILAGTNIFTPLIYSILFYSLSEFATLMLYSIFQDDSFNFISN